MNLIDTVFQSLRTAKRPAFIPFITGGDPDLPGTVRIGEAIIDAGADLLEIGFPYSDPIADGPVIQASYTRALDRGLKLDDLFGAIRQLATSRPQTPLVGMVSYSIIHRRGSDRFLGQAKQAGLSGLIVPDLPVDESANLSDAAAKYDLKCIHLVTPTTPRERAIQIAARSTGFVYCVSVSGITGARDRLPEELRDQLAWLRTQTKLPLCVGFGVSKPEHVQQLRDSADGIIVGSALVRHLENFPQRKLDEIIEQMTTLTRSLRGFL